MYQKERIRLFTEAVWQWFERHKRTLPWRDLSIADDTERAYRILVSEIMLQQTQVSRVQNVYKNFLHVFPKLEDLAKASNRDVIMAWRGMGYNSRALRLRDAAKTIVKTFHGVFPREMNDLLSIKGIGLYTAAAVRNFAFNIPTPCIDTNIRRILHRTFYGPENPDGTWRIDDKKLLKMAERVLEVALNLPPSPSPFLHGRKGGKKVTSSPPLVEEGLGVEGRDTRNWHAALMDLGSLVQTKNSPKWEICPLTSAGCMKTTQRNVKMRDTKQEKRAAQEPGRMIAGKYVPNRIIRGRIVEELRDAHRGLSAEKIGAAVCIDWHPAEHRDWLAKLLSKLETESMIRRKGNLYILHD